MTRSALLIGGAGGTGILIAQSLRRAGYAVTILHRGVHEPPEIADFPHLHADPHFAESVAPVLAGRRWDAVVITYGRLAALAPLFAGRCEHLIAVGGIPIYAGYLDPSSTAPPGLPVGVREDFPRAEPDRMTASGAATFARRMLAAEDAVFEQHANGGYAATLVRYPVVYGPRAIGRAEWSIARRVRDRRPFILLPHAGLSVISRCATVNCAHLVGLALGNPAAHGRVFNCADDDQYALGQWVQMSLDALGSTAEIIPLPESLTWAAAHLVPLGGSTSPHAVVDASAARLLLGYSDAVPARRALLDSLDWACRHPPSDADQRAWDDPFDYPLEDEVRARLDAFEADCAPLRREPVVAHPYPHPKTPGAGPDHRGR